MKSYVANFNAESFWRDDQLTKLPAMTDDQADVIVGVMDEMQFVFSHHSEDKVVTRLPMNATHLEYLDSLGLRFQNTSVITPDKEEVDISHFRENVFEMMYQSGTQAIHAADELSPFAVIPFTDKIQSAGNFKNALPELNVTRKVNSKEFSCMVSNEISGTDAGWIVRSADELVEIGSILLKEGPFLVKDFFGVSGKGNLKIESDFLMQRIAKYVKKQEKEGKSTGFVVERLLDKAQDFSCQFHIGRDGTVELVSTHQFHNAGFAFSGSQLADQQFTDDLEKRGYYNTIRKLGARLFAEGYFGDVCIDSMILTDNTIVPIIEINARKSMSLINHYTHRHLLSKYGKTGMMLSFSFNVPTHIRFEHLFNQMKAQGILFNRNSTQGVLPLSALTFEVNGLLAASSQQTSGIYKGKLYATIVSESPEEREGIIESLNTAYSLLGLTVTQS